jgi:hypothetical protein
MHKFTWKTTWEVLVALATSILGRQGRGLLRPGLVYVSDRNSGTSEIGIKRMSDIVRKKNAEFLIGFAESGATLYKWTSEDTGSTIEAIFETEGDKSWWTLSFSGHNGPYWDFLERHGFALVEN